MKPLILNENITRRRLYVLSERNTIALESKLEYQHRDLIEACKCGDRQAQFRLYHLYVHAMYNACFRIVGNQADAEDVVQNGFIKAFTKLNSFGYKSTFGAWLKRIMMNEAVNFLKSRKISMWTSDELPESPMEEIKDDLEYTVSAIKDGMKKLSNGYKQILSLYLLEGYDHQEISEIVGISVSTSKSQYHRAKKRLLDIIKSEI